MIREQYTLGRAPGGSRQDPPRDNPGTSFGPGTSRYCLFYWSVTPIFFFFFSPFFTRCLLLLLRRMETVMEDLRREGEIPAKKGTEEDGGGEGREEWERKGKRREREKGEERRNHFRPDV